MTFEEQLERATVLAFTLNEPVPTCFLDWKYLLNRVRNDHCTGVWKDVADRRAHEFERVKFLDGTFARCRWCYYVW